MLNLVQCSYHFKIVIQYTCILSVTNIDNRVRLSTRLVFYMKFQLTNAMKK